MAHYAFRTNKRLTGHTHEVVLVADDKPEELVATLHCDLGLHIFISGIPHDTSIFDRNRGQWIAGTIAQLLLEPQQEFVQ